MPSTTKRRRYRLHPTMVVLTLLTAVSTLKARTEAARHDEAGNVITDNLAWIVFGVIAIVAIGAAVKVLGGAVINWVTKTLGV